jgi:hypothetical protein
MGQNFYRLNKEVIRCVIVRISTQCVALTDIFSRRIHLSVFHTLISQTGTFIALLTNLDYS